MADILPPETANVTSPHWAIEGMAQVDGCPECVVNTQTPWTAEVSPALGRIARYVCSDCGTAWVTSWGL